MTVNELVWAGALKGMESFGLRLVRVTSTTIYVTVPKTSDQVDVNGIPMAGEHLAKRCKVLIDALTGGNFAIKYKEV